MPLRAAFRKRAAITRIRARARAIDVAAAELDRLLGARPARLANSHNPLHAAVAATYGWPADTATKDALERLLALNLERSAC